MLFPGIIYRIIWTSLLLVAANAGVLRQLEDDQEESCTTYIRDDVLYLDCSDKELVELPEELDNNVRIYRHLSYLLINFKEFVQ